MPIIIYSILLVGEFTGIYLNYQTKFDTIKWRKPKDINILDNIFIRMMGWYLFQIGFFAPLVLITYKDKSAFIDVIFKTSTSEY